MIKSKNRKGWSKRFIKILGLKTTYLEDYIPTENLLKRKGENYMYEIAKKVKNNNFLIYVIGLSLVISTIMMTKIFL